MANNNAFRMLFRLPRDCSASGMFAVNNVMPLSGNLYLVFTRE